MKILQIIYDDVKNPWLGGGGSFRALEINKILAKEHQITVVTGKFKDAVDGTEDEIDYVRLGKANSYLGSRVSFTIAVPGFLKKHAADYDIVVNEFSVFSPCFCYWHTKTPVVNTFYHIIGKQAFRKSLLLGIPAFIAEKLFLKTAKNIITISPSVTDIIQPTQTHSTQTQGKSKNIKCIYTGFDEPLLDVERAPNSDYIAFVGRIDIYMKGLDILVSALKKCKNTDIKLRIAGGGPKENTDKLNELIDSADLKHRVTVLGRISDEEKKTFLGGARFLVMPSRFEGWGISSVEAAACGIAVIGTDIPGLKDAIVKDETGILVEKENDTELSAAMDRLWQDKELADKLGRNGKKWAGNFKWGNIAAKQLEFYQEII